MMDTPHNQCNTPALGFEHMMGTTCNALILDRLWALSSAIHQLWTHNRHNHLQNTHFRRIMGEMVSAEGLIVTQATTVIYSEQLIKGSEGIIAAESTLTSTARNGGASVPRDD